MGLSRFRDAVPAVPRTMRTTLLFRCEGKQSPDSVHVPVVVIVLCVEGRSLPPRSDGFFSVPIRR